MKNIKKRYKFSIHVYEMMATVFNRQVESIHYNSARASFAVERKLSHSQSEI